MFSRARHRHRPELRSRQGPPVPEVQPGRQQHHAQIRRHRAGPRHQQAAGRAHGRHHVGGERWPGASGSIFRFTIQRARRLPRCPQAPASRFHRRATRRCRGKRMLVVDDNATNRRILALQAAKWGMVVAAMPHGAAESAADGSQQAQTFDLAIIDMHMPDMDGADAGASASAQCRPSRCRWYCSPRSAGEKPPTGERCSPPTLAKPLRQSPVVRHAGVGLLAQTTLARA